MGSLCLLGTGGSLLAGALILGEAPAEGNGSFEDVTGGTDPSDSGIETRFAANAAGQVASIPGWSATWVQGTVGFDDSVIAAGGVYVAMVEPNSKADFISDPVVGAIGAGEILTVSFETANDMAAESATFGVSLIFDGGTPIPIGAVIETGIAANVFTERSFQYITAAPAGSVAVAIHLDNANGGNDRPRFDRVRLTTDGGAPTINRFTVSDGIITDSAIAVPSDSTVTLGWSVGYAQNVSISAGIGTVGPSGSLTVNSGTGIVAYTLTATRSTGSTDAVATVHSDPFIEGPVITEFLANTTATTLADEDGDAEDWIEIANPNPFALHVGGYHLSDDLADLNKWQIPFGAFVPAGGYLVVFASGKDRAVAGSELHTNFRLDADVEELLLVAPDGFTILNHYVWTEATSHPGGISFGLDGDLGTEQFFVNATPGSVNDSPIFLRSAVLFSEPSRSFTGSLSVVMTPEIPGLEVRYTTDNSEPTASSALATAAVPITASTMLRACVFDPLDPDAVSDVSARSYIELSTQAIPANLHAGTADTAGFSSNLPVIVLENFGGPAAGDVDFETTTLTVFEPAPGGRTNLADLPTLSTRAAYHIRGQSSAHERFLKKQYRIELRNQEEEDKDLSLLGLPADSDWVLNGPYVDKSLIRNVFTFRFGRDIGLLAPRTRMVELFLNEAGGDLDYERDYRGVYVLMETIKQQGDRVAITKLEPGANAEPEISGGYIVKYDDPDPTLVDPDPVTQATTIQKNWITGHLAEFEDVLFGPDFKDPVLGYAALCDVESWVNLFVVNELNRDQDAFERSHYLYKDRGGKLFFGPLWDYNFAYGVGCCRNNTNADPADNTQPSVGNDSGWMWLENDVLGSGPEWQARVLQDADFEQRLIDRWQELRNSSMSGDALDLMMAECAAGLGESVVRNFAYWNQVRANNPWPGESPADLFQAPAPVLGFASPTSTTQKVVETEPEYFERAWDEQIATMNWWTDRRMAWIDSQFTKPPRVSPSGGVAGIGSNAVVTGTTGVVYYTSDGSDPRLPGGAVDPGALSYATGGRTEVPLVLPGDTWNYLDDGSDLGDSTVVAGTAGYNASRWTHPGFVDSAWGSGPAPLGYGDPVATEIDDGVPPNPADQGNITAYFRKTFTVTNLSAYGGLEMEIQYDDGVIVYLNGKIVLRENMPTGPVLSTTLANVILSGSDETTWQRFVLDPDILLEGTNVIAIELHQAIADSADARMDFSLSGYLPGAGAPPAMQISGPMTITARTLEGGEWSGPVSETYIVDLAADSGNLAVSEVHYNPSAPSQAEIGAGYVDSDDFEFIELLNTVTAAIDLTGVRFTAGIDFAFANNELLGAGQRIIIARNRAALLFRYPGLPPGSIVGEFQNGTGLSNGGETITLVAQDNSVIQSFTYDDLPAWPITPDGGGPSIVLVDPFGMPNHDDPLNWRASVILGGTPSDTDGTAFAGAPEEFNAYAFGTAGIPAAAGRTVDGHLEFTVEQNQLAEDLEGALERSDDLISWFPTGADYLRSTVTRRSDGTATVTWRSIAPTNPEGAEFLRWRVIQR